MNMIIAKLTSIVQELKRRVFLLISIGKVHRVDDSKDLQQLQIEAMPGEIHDSVVKFGHYGLATHPKPGSDAIVLFPRGERNQGIVIAIEDKRFRFKSLAPGEVALYTDEGDHIYFRRDKTLAIQTRQLNIQATDKVRIQTPQLEVTGDILDKADTNQITFAKMREQFDNHQHLTEQGSLTSTPIGTTTSKN